jgi:hypothetical protein
VLRNVVGIFWLTAEWPDFNDTGTFCPMSYNVVAKFIWQTEMQTIGEKENS